MKKLLLGVVAATTLATGAMAQYTQPGPPPPGGPHGGYGGTPGGGWSGGDFWRGAPMGAHERIQFLQDRINRGIGDGSLNRGEARGALHELDSIRRMDRDMHMRDHGRLTPGDEQAVQARLDNLSRRLHWERHNGY